MGLFIMAMRQVTNTGQKCQEPPPRLLKVPEVPLGKVPDCVYTGISLHVFANA